MAIYLTQLGSDNFQRANENPVSQGGKWVKNTVNDPALQVVNDVLETTEGGPNNFNEGAIYSGVALPDDQYVAITLGTFSLADNAVGANSYFGPCIRFTEGGLHFEHEPCYMLWLTPDYNSYGGLWQLTWGAYNNIAEGYGLTISPGDIITLACIGTTLYFYQNTTLVWSGTVTNYASGGAALVLQNTETNNANYTVSNWSVGSASVTETSGSFTPGGTPPTPPAGGVFLGSVLQVSGPPNSSILNPYLGKVTVLAEPPSGVGAAGTAGNPCIGSVIIAAKPPAGFSDVPPLGNVCIIASAPAITPNPPFLGTVTDS